MLWYSLEAPWQGASNEYRHCTFFWKTGENYPIAITKYSFFTIPLVSPWSACTLLSCWTRINTAFANSVDPDQLASKKPTDLDLHCLSFSMWIYISNLDQKSDWLRIKSRCGILIYSAGQGLRGLDTLGRFSVKRDNFCDFSFALLERGLLWKKRICSQGEQFFPFIVDPFSEGRQNIVWKSYFPWKCSNFL